MNEQNQRDGMPDNGQGQQQPTTPIEQNTAGNGPAPTQRIEASDVASEAPTAAAPVQPSVAPTAATQRIEAPEQVAPEQAAQAPAEPTAPTQRIEPQRVIDDAYPSVQAPFQPQQAPWGQQAQEPQVAQAAAQAAGSPAAAQPTAPQTAAYGTAPGTAPSGTEQPGAAYTGNPYGWTAAPGVAPHQQQSNPYGAYPQTWSQQPRAKAPMSPGKRKALRWGAAAGALALAVTMGGVSGWAFGHQAGQHEAQAQTQQQQLQQGNGTFGQGNGSNGSNGTDTTDPFGGSQGSGNGQQFQQLPYGNYGNGSTDEGSNSSVEQGTKLDNGLAGMVIVDTQLNGGEGAGTGMILSSDGYVLTNYHVVESSTEVKVTDSTTGKSYTATVVGRDSTHDVALLKLKDASGLQTVSMASGSVNEGDAVHAVGNASGEGYLRKLTGKVTATEQSITTQSEAATEGERLSNLIETDADVVPGYSGGALMNDAGQVVGMTTAASSGKTSATVDGYAIPISEAMQIAEKIKAGESSDTIQIGRGAALGISVLSTDTGQVGGGYGVTVQEVIDGGAVAKSGLAAGDTIIGLDGKTVKSYAALKEILSGHKAGDKVELTWLNSSGKQKTADVTLGESSVN